MKQNITVDQVNEIDDWTEILIDFNLFDYTKIQHIGVTDKEISEKFTIGKLVEILHNEECTLVIIQHSRNTEIKITRGLEVHIFNDKELCNALWDAVKEVIN